MVMLAKGNRSSAVTRACKTHGGLPRFHRRSAAILAQNNIKKVDVLEFPELGMEAVWKIHVENFRIRRRRRQGSQFLLKWTG